MMSQVSAIKINIYAGVAITLFALLITLGSYLLPRPQVLLE
jgi:hypothetical protein